MELRSTHAQAASRSFLQLDFSRAEILSSLSLNPHLRPHQDGERARPQSSDIERDVIEDINDQAAVTLLRLFVPPPALPSNAHLLGVAVRQIVARGDPEQNRLAGWSPNIPIAVEVRCGFDPHAEGLWHAIKSL
jgi:hypothetical protein